MTDKKNIVVIGGGTGTHTVLQGLKRYQTQAHLSAVVTMADSGGSTGRLRDEFGYLPVGDVRMALAALASDIDHHEELLRELFLYRFDKGEGLSGHNFGNLLLVALTDILGSEEAAIAAAGKLLRVQGRVIPVTTQAVHLVAQYADGQVVTGEHDIDEPEWEREKYAITNLSVAPAATISERAEAIRNSAATVVYVSNLMTKRGQTTGMGVAQHVAELTQYSGRAPDCVLVNTTPLPSELLQKYAGDNERPVEFNLEASGCRVIPADLLATEAVLTAAGDTLKRSLIRHDSRKLARKLIELL
jgi:2-phospho-L-lactate transferase/gluconeogenesis factor (CofD/UPF0052 family)